MAWPSLTVRIATAVGANAFTLDDATLGRFADPPTIPGYPLGDTFGKVWSDITEDVRGDAGVSIVRGSTRQQGPAFIYEAGRLSFSLDDRSGDYDPLNLSGPFVSANVSQLLPGLPVQVRADYAGGTFTLFTGYVDNWTKTYPGEGNTDSVVQVTATDPGGTLARAARGEQVEQGEGEYLYQRLGRVLDNVTWPQEQRIIDESGPWTCGPTTLNTDAWTELQNTATSVNGYLFVSVNGDVVYQDRSSFARSADITVGDGQMLPVVDLELANDWDQVFNVVRLARPEGVQQTTVDEESIARFGLRNYSRNDLVVDDDSQVGDVADYLLFQFKDQQLRLDGVVLEPDDTYSDDQWTRLLSLEMLQRISATMNTTDGRTVTTDGLLRGVSLDVRPYRWVWKVSTTAVPGTLGNFTLDDSDIGVLGIWSVTDLAIIKDYAAFVKSRFGGLPAWVGYFEIGKTKPLWTDFRSGPAQAIGWSTSSLDQVTDWDGYVPPEITIPAIYGYPVETYATLALF